MGLPSLTNAEWVNIRYLWPTAKQSTTGVGSVQKRGETPPNKEYRTKNITRERKKKETPELERKARKISIK